MSDEPRLHNLPIHLPYPLYRAYTNLKQRQRLPHTASAAAAFFDAHNEPQLAAWIKRNPRAWQHGRLYGFEPKISIR